MTTKTEVPILEYLDIISNMVDSAESHLISNLAQDKHDMRMISSQFGVISRHLTEIKKRIERKLGNDQTHS